jgi:hypothetical protein
VEVTLGTMVRTTLLLSLALSGSALGQAVAISGTVTATDSVKLRGVAVRVVPTGVHTVTDAAGKYSLTVPSDGVLSFSVEGRRPVQLQVLGRDTVDVSMELDQHGWWAAIPSGRPVRFTSSGQLYEGTFTNWSGERIDVNTSAASQSIPIREIEMVWEHAPATDRGMRIGGLVGAALFGGTVYVGVSQQCQREACRRNQTIVASLGSAVLGTIAGAFVGAGLGSGFTHWKRVHP